MIHAFQGKRILVVGLGISGRAAAQFLLKRGATVVATDKKVGLIEQEPAVAHLCRQGMHIVEEREALAEVETVVVSPGIPTTHACYQGALSTGIEVIGEVELACRGIEGKCLAVTGTNGKTTVTMLVEHVLKHRGMRVQALGNIGTPITAALDEPEAKNSDVFVLELSSFQLETLHQTCIDAGVILNITPDHLDRYPTMKAYAAVKISLQHNIKPGGSLFVEDACYQTYRSFFEEGMIKTYGYHSQNAIHTDFRSVFQKKWLFDLPAALLGKKSHDVENLMAAYALCDTVGATPAQFLSALATFKKPEHRLEFVRTIGGIHYVNDSKGTNIDAVIRAVEQMPGKVVLVAGGVDKGFPYTPWKKAFEGKVKAIMAIGEAKEKIKRELGAWFRIAPCETLEQAVCEAASAASEGDTILLSPGCSSYDMFRDYAHRGSEFKRIVNSLIAL